MPASFAGIETRAGRRGKGSILQGATKMRGRLSKGFGPQIQGLVASVPDNPAIHRSACIPQSPYPAYIEPISGGYRTPRRKAKRKADFLRPARAGTRAGSPVRGTDVGGAAESVRTPTADRCCHEGRLKPSMVRWAKPARVEIGVVRNGRCPSGGDWQDRQNQGRLGATTLRKLLPRLVPDLTGRRWEKSQRRLSFGLPLQHISPATDAFRPQSQAKQPSATAVMRNSQSRPNPALFPGD